MSDMIVPEDISTVVYKWIVTAGQWPTDEDGFLVTTWIKTVELSPDIEDLLKKASAVKITKEEANVLSQWLASTEEGPATDIDNPFADEEKEVFVQPEDTIFTRLYKYRWPLMITGGSLILLKLLSARE